MPSELKEKPVTINPEESFIDETSTEMIIDSSEKEEVRNLIENRSSMCKLEVQLQK